MAKVDRLEIRDFAQIGEAKLSFGDLTVLVGAQGTGKSLALQWLKVAMDGKHIIAALRDAGHTPTDIPMIIDLIFGVGMGAAWRDSSKIELNGKNVDPRTIGKRGSSEEKAFYIPAHRAMLISDGWAAPFQKLTSGTPVVARIFSQNLFDRFSARGGDKLFPLERVLKKQAARDQLRGHLKTGKGVARWFWVASGKVHFANTEKARRRLDQHGIQFVGKKLLPKHLQELKA